MRQALARQPWDVVLSDYSMPRFDAPAALALLQEHAVAVPFIVVSGSVGEDTAVAAMKAGATDYVMKDRMLGRADDRRQHVVEVVRHAAGRPKPRGARHHSG